MYSYRKIKDDIFWIGASDRRIALFENAFPVPRGMSYNSYLVADEKTVLIDTVDKAVLGIFADNLKNALSGRALDYLIINHMEPDHCATVGEVLLRYPEVKIIGNAKTLAMLSQFFDFDVTEQFVTIMENNTLSTGKHEFSFLMAPMVHWPEVMVTYEKTEKILFSADAFGTFGALNGNIFADEVDFERTRFDEARRYYSNIVGKYGISVQNLFKKTSALEIEMICPLHGPVWRENISWYIEKYNKWSLYQPEENAVMIAYASIYGGTENAASILAERLAELGVKNIEMYDVSSTHHSVIVAEAFRCSHLVFASVTYNGAIFSEMHKVLHALSEHALQNRTVAIIENGSWAPQSGKLMREAVSGMKNMNIIDGTVTIKSTVKEAQREALYDLAKKIYNSMQGN